LLKKNLLIFLVIASSIGGMMETLPHI
jgi:hypothetical protein